MKDRAVISVARAALFFLLVIAFSFPVAPAAAARQTIMPIWQQVEGKEIERLAQEKLDALFLAAGETRRRDVVLMTPPRDFRLPAGIVTFSVEAPQGLSYSRGTPISVAVFVDGKLYRRLSCYYRIRVYDTVLVAAKTILPDQVITEGDLRLEEREVTNVNDRCIVEKQVAVGHVVNRLLKEGALITESMLKQPVVVEQGATVLLVSHYRGIEVRVPAVALSPGRVGQQIRVRNEVSGKVMLATVVDAGTVRIGA